MSEIASFAYKRKRASGIPTGNAGEYFVMGELLRRGYDAQLADRNTKGYDLLVGDPEDAVLRKVQVKTVRLQPWYVKTTDFEGEFLTRSTIYVLIGAPLGTAPVRYFIAKNASLKDQVHRPPKWVERGVATGFVSLKALKDYEDLWHTLIE